MIHQLIGRDALPALIWTPASSPARLLNNLWSCQHELLLVSGTPKGGSQRIQHWVPAVPYARALVRGLSCLGSAEPDLDYGNPP